jgi:DnaK suppressor protein
MAKKAKHKKGKTSSASSTPRRTRLVSAKKTGKRSSEKTAPAPSKAAKSHRTKQTAAKKNSGKLTADETKKLKALLLRIRAHITGQINFLTTDNLSRTQDDSDLDFRSEEQGTDNFDRDLALSRVSMEQNALFEIDEALNRIQTKTYGQCEICGKPIEKGRLAVLPYSRLCVSCQSKAETGLKTKRYADGSVFRDSEAAGKEVEAEEEE